MKKIILLLVIIFIALAMPVSAETFLTGGVDYNVDSARTELIQNKPQKLNSQLVTLNIIDKNHSENISAMLKGQVELKDRTLAHFSDGTYGVIYRADQFHVWYYNSDGTLLYSEEKDGLNYPYKSYKYNTGGKLVNMGLRVSKGETFIYTPEGKLIAHWVNSNGYDENGNIVMTRKYQD